MALSDKRSGGGYLERRRAGGKRYFAGDTFEKPLTASAGRDLDEDDVEITDSHRERFIEKKADPEPGQQINPLIILRNVLIGVLLIAVVFMLRNQARDQAYFEGAQDTYFSLKREVDDNAPLVTDRLEAEALATEPWINRVDLAYAADRKLNGVLVDSSGTDHFNIALFEKTKLGRPGESALHLLFAWTRDEKRAGVLLLHETDNLGVEDRTVFESAHKLNGGRGFLYLGQYYFTGRMSFVPTPRDRRPVLQEYSLADSSGPIFGLDPARAFRYFHMASLCNVSDAYRWRNSVTQNARLSEAVQSSERLAAQNELNELIGLSGVGREMFCNGSFVKSRLSRLHPRMLIDDRKLMTMTELTDLLWQPEDSFRAFLAARRGDIPPGAPLGPGAEYRAGWGGAGAPPPGWDFDGGAAPPPGYTYSDGSKYYRDSPGGGMPSPELTMDGLPDVCRTANPPAECSQRFEALSCGDASRYYYNRGEAEMARGALAEARAFFSRSIDVGRSCGSDFAVISSKRLGALNLTCEYTPDSLRRIARGNEYNPEGGDIIDLTIRQRALKALGHYRDDVDGRYGPNTREAITSFQREFGFRETGDLTPLETVYLVCGAAEIARDVNSYTALGLMYVTGYGVVQNTDLGLQWLKQAARDGDDDALYNLAIIYGSGTVLSSYVICDVVENEEQADAYLEEAAREGHPVALKLVRAYGHLRTRERWAQIRIDLGFDENPLPDPTDTKFERRLENVGKGCEPNPAP